MVYTKPTGSVSALVNIKQYYIVAKPNRCDAIRPKRRFSTDLHREKDVCKSVETSFCASQPQNDSFHCHDLIHSV